MGHAASMSKNASPWVRGRGLERLLAQETDVSDFIQFLSDRDPSPWAELVGFIPDEVTREALAYNHADLLLTSGSKAAVVEVKLGHLMAATQQERYEALESHPDLYLAALAADQARLASNSGRWRFLSLSDLVSRWEKAHDELARLFASETAEILRGWDRMISGVFAIRPAEDWAPLTALTQKFLARVVTRRIAQDLCVRGHFTKAGVTSGGGLPLVQGWTSLRGEDKYRTFIAEIRWWEAKPGGELRFGVDFYPRPWQPEDEELRRAAYELARSMHTDIDYASLKGHITKERPELAELLRREKPSRPKAKGDWEHVIVYGLEVKNSRRRTSPDFYGDGALRFQAIADIDFERASARDLTDLIDFTLKYLSSRQPIVDPFIDRSQELLS